MNNIIYDEYGRASCAAHDRPECHICGLSFIEMNEEIDETPSDRDVGVFLSDSSLIEWHAKMKIKMPRVFPPDEKVFGNDTTQHPYGTKLLTYFDGDKNKPMHATVLGSRWKKDGFCKYPGMASHSPYVDGLEPMYTLLMHGELTQDGLMDAHMEEEGVGWDAIGREETVDPRLDALARAHQNNHGRDGNSDEEDSSDWDSSMERFDNDRFGYDDTAALTVPTQNRHIRRALKRLLLEENSMVSWDPSFHGDFLERFIAYSFSASERDHIMNVSGSVLSNDNIADKVKSFPITTSRPLQPDEKNFHARVVMAQLVVYFLRDKFGAVILRNERGTKFQAMEWNDMQEIDGLPCLSITYATDPEGAENPEAYLRGEVIKMMEVPNELAVALEDHLLNCVSNHGLNDIGSGLLYHEGFFVPMEIIPLDTGKSSGMGTSLGSIPDVNFGVELELSCASGNYQQRVASSIAKHAKVDVKIGRPSAKGGGKGSGDGGGKGGGGGFPHQKGSRSGSDRHAKWKLVYDKSIQPNARNPQSSMFELVSPILSGNPGLDELSNTVVVMTDVACVRTNKSMGAHVHVEARDYSLDGMKSICQQFLRFEEIIDGFLPFHRRTGSDKSHSYFESNILSVMSRHRTFEGSLKAISSCRTPNALYDMMNPGFRDRYHKLNLQNLRTGRQPTLEFRQHHATKDEREIVAWVRFCVLFVVNASKLQPLAGDGIISDATFDELFEKIVVCPILREYYSKKRASFENRD